MKDIAGRKLKKGQTVVSVVGGSSKELKIWTITGFTPKQVRLKTGPYRIRHQFPNQLAIIGKPNT